MARFPPITSALALPCLFSLFDTAVMCVLSLKRICLRLDNAAGEWKLIPISDNSTMVSYSWNGELLGDFPNWALSQAWETRGVEVLTWLKDAIKE